MSGSKLRQFFLDNFRRKTILLYSGTLLLILTITLIAVSYVSYQNILQENISYLSQINAQINNTLYLLISEAERAYLLNITDKEVTEILTENSDSSPSGYADRMRLMETKTKNAALLNPFVASIMFESANGVMYGDTDNYGIFTRQFPGFDYVEQIALNRFHRIITAPYQGRYGSRMTIIRSILVPESLQVIGYCWVNMDYRKISELFLNVLSAKAANHYAILDQSSVPLFRSGNTEFLFEELAVPERLAGTQTAYWTQYIGDTEYLVVAQTAESDGLYLVQYMPHSYVMSSAFGSLRNFYLIAAAVIIVVGGASILLISRQLNPLQKLMDGMREVAGGNFGVYVEEESGDAQIRELTETFNEMLRRLKTGVEREYILQMNEKRMELYMLQTQINPHFLYNTLNLISSIAEIANVDSIVDISICLSDLFRYNIKGEQSVRLADEFQQIKNYLRIYEYRYPGKYKVTVEENDLGEHIIPKFILQPIVENAVSHGLYLKDKDGQLDIRARRNGDRLIIEVKDNGVGMDEETLESLRSALRAEHTIIAALSTEAIGLQNVHQRIQLHCGQAYGVEVESAKGVGAHVAINLPCMKAPEEEESSEMPDC